MAKTTTPKKRQEPAVTSDASAYARLQHNHQRFVDEYLIDFNATRSYKRVPGWEKVADKSASTLSNRLLGKVEIQAAIAERKLAATKRCEMSADRIILEAARIATFDIRKIYNPDGSMKLPHEIDDDTAAAISSFEVLEEFEGQGKDRVMVGHTKKVRTVDKKGSVELAMKFLGLLKEKVEVDPSDKMVALMRSMQGSALLPVAKVPAADPEQ